MKSRSLVPRRPLPRAVSAARARHPETTATRASAGPAARPPLVLAGQRSAALGRAITQELGGDDVDLVLESFPDGEIHVEVHSPVAGRDVYVVQALASPVGDAALELLLLADAVRNAGASTVTALLPYVGYARHDRRTREGQPLGAKVFADVVNGACFDRIVALDVHSPALVCGFAGPVQHLTAIPLLVAAVRPLLKPDMVVVSPDLGGVKLAETFARAFDLPIAVVHKIRRSATEVSSQDVWGDVVGREALIIDDMVSTGGTIVAAVAALRARGCVAPPIVAAVHALLVGAACDKLRALDLARLVVSDSVTLRPGLDLPLDVVPLAPLFSRAIRALHAREPLGDLLASR